MSVITRTHVDLFTGIGGFALAAQANDVQTIAMCEIDANCRAFLSKAWPNVEIHDDVRNFDAVRYAGAWLVTGGVPCQPASRAGKQRGSDDDSWLWPDAIRVISGIRPTWALLENPPGIGDVGLAGVLSDLEGLGYEVQVVGIPACAVGAPHRRERYWIIGHRGVGQADADSAGHQGTDAEPGAHGLRAEHRQGVADAGRIGGGQDEQQRGQAGRDADRRDRANDVGDTKRISGDGRRRSGWRAARSCSGDDRPITRRDSFWRNATYVPCADGKFRRAPDDSFDVAHGLHRSLLAALGNSIVPQVAERIIAAMIAAEVTP